MLRKTCPSDLFLNLLFTTAVEDLIRFKMCVVFIFFHLVTVVKLENSDCLKQDN